MTKGGRSFGARTRERRSTARLSASGAAPDESEDDETASCGSGGAVFFFLAKWIKDYQVNSQAASLSFYTPKKGAEVFDP